MSPNEPLPIFLPRRYLLPTLSSMLPEAFRSLHIHVWLGRKPYLFRSTGATYR